MPQIKEEIHNILCEDGNLRTVYRVDSNYSIRFFNGKKRFTIAGVIVGNQFIAQGKNRLRLKMPLLPQKKKVVEEKKKETQLEQLGNACKLLLDDHSLFLVLDCLSVYATEKAKKATKLENKEQKQAWMKSAKLLSELSSIAAIVETEKVIKDHRKDKNNDQIPNHSQLPLYLQNLK